MLHMSLGLAGEVGELVDAVKKSVIYGKPLDYENVQEELGDIEFHLEGLRQVFDLSRPAILTANFNKLQKRYPERKYSDADAVNRADKLAVVQSPPPLQPLQPPRPTVCPMEQRFQVLEMAFLDLCEAVAHDLGYTADDIAFRTSRQLINLRS